MRALEYLYRMKKANDEMGMGAQNIDEAIAELEEMQQSKSCEGCKYYTSTLCPVEEFSIASAELEKYPFYCNRHEPKEQ